jgi:hypothetical protein
MCFANNPPGTTRCTDASGANPWVQTTETNVDLFGPFVYCEENGGTTPSKTDAKCEDSVVKALVKFVGAKTKCYQKCNANIASGKIPPGGCTPPATDPATSACVSDPMKGAQAKAAASIDKACFTAPATAPSCFPFTSGTAWVNAVEALEDPQIAEINCGSPSGSFLN